MLGYQNKRYIIWLLNPFLILVIGALSDGNAQSFSIKISSPEDERCKVCSPYSDNSTLVLLDRGIFEPDMSPSEYFANYRNLIYLISETGAITDSAEIDHHEGNDLDLRGFIMTGDSLIVWGNAFKHENSKVQLTQLWLDEDLQIVRYNLYGNYNESTLFNCQIRDNEGNFIFAGSSWADSTNNLILVKLDQDGNFIQEQLIAGAAIPWPNIGYLPINDKLICGSYNWIAYINNLDLTLDTVYYPLSFYFFSVGLYRPYDDQHVIIPANFLKIPPNYGRNPGCMVIDSAAQSTASVVFELPDEINYAIKVDYISIDTLFLGAIQNAYSYPPEMGFCSVDRWFVLYKFNINGDIYWERFFGGDANYVLLEVTAMPDGGCVIMGSYYDWRNNQVWERDVVIIRVDANGLLSGLAEPAQPLVVIYPNPSQGKIFMQWQKPVNEPAQSATVKIFDITGRQVFSTEIHPGTDALVDISGHPSGVYLARVISGQSIMNRKIILSK